MFKFVHKTFVIQETFLVSFNMLRVPDKAPSEAGPGAGLGIPALDQSFSNLSVTHLQSLLYIKQFVYSHFISVDCVYNVVVSPWSIGLATSWSAV